MGLEMAQNESQMRIIAKTMDIKESTAIAVAKTELSMAVAALAKYDITAAQQALVESRILDDEDEDPTGGDNPNTNAAVGAGAVAGGAAS